MYSNWIPSFRLLEDIETRLTDMVRKNGHIKTLYTLEAILEYLDETEGKYLALDRLRNLGKRATLDELEQDLDLERF